MDAGAAARRCEWRDFCAGGGAAAAAWWAAYEAAYDAALRWSKKASHAPFCYELLVTMLALAADTRAEKAVGGGGEAFATSARRWKLLSLLAAGSKREPLRSVCVPLLGQLAELLPPEEVS